MPYMPAQSLLKTLLLTCTSFGAADVVEGDERILDRGITNACILYPGALPEYNTARMHRENLYETSLELFTKYTDTTAYATFGTLRDAVLSTLSAAPCLSAGYFITGITGEGEPSEVYEVADGQRRGPYFIMQRLRVAIQENV